MGFLEGLIHVEHRNIGALECTVGHDNELDVARHARHVTGYDAIHRMIIASSQQHHAAELRPLPVGARKTGLDKDLDEVDIVLCAVVFEVGHLLLQRCLMLGLLGSAYPDVAIGFAGVAGMWVCNHGIPISSTKGTASAVTARSPRKPLLH